MKIVSRRLPLLCLSSIIALSACSTGAVFDSDTPVDRSYIIQSLPAAQPSGEPLPVDVAVARPDVAPGLDTDRVAVLKGRELDYYRGVRWSADSHDMLQALIVDSLQDQRLFRSVTAEQSRVTGDYTLDVQLRDFQAEYDDRGPPTAHVALIARLIRVFDRRLVATFELAAHEPAREERMSIVAESFERATHRVLADLAAQAAAAVRGDAEQLRKAQE